MGNNEIKKEAIITLSIFAILMLLFYAGLQLITSENYETVDNITVEKLELIVIEQNVRIVGGIFLIEEADFYDYKYKIDGGYKNGRIYKFSSDLVLVEDPNLKDTGFLTTYATVPSWKKQDGIIGFMLNGGIADSIAGIHKKNWKEIRVPLGAINKKINQL